MTEYRANGTPVFAKVCQHENERGVDNREWECVECGERRPKTLAEIAFAGQYEYLLLSREDSDRLVATGHGDDYWKWLNHMRDLGDSGSDQALFEHWMGLQ